MFCYKYLENFTVKKHEQTEESALLSIVSNKIGNENSKELEDLVKELNKDFLGSSIADNDKLVISSLTKARNMNYIANQKTCFNYEYTHSYNKPNCSEYYRTFTIQEVEEDNFDDGRPQELEFSIYSQRTEKQDLNDLVKELKEEKKQNQILVQTAEKLIKQSNP